MRLGNDNKYVYVLTSSENDIYYEQFFLSLASMRLYNPDAEVIALIDEKTKRGLTEKRCGYEKLVSEIKVIAPPDEFSQKEASRWLKTSIHRYITGEFLFIDCDTIITDKLDYDLPSGIKIGAVLDNHVTLEKHHLQKFFQKEDTSVGFSSSLKTNRRYNGGLIFCGGDSQALDFFEKWHSLWIESRKRGCSQDMPSLNQANYEMSNIITELSGELNCQISHNGLPFLHNAKIIHYYATSLNSADPAFKLSSPPVFASIKETGELSPEIMKLLENPKSAFEPLSRIVSDNAVIEALDSSFLFKLIRFNKRHPWLSKRWNDFSVFIVQSVKRLLGKC
jgi:hypothetical protein